MNTQFETGLSVTLTVCAVAVSVTFLLQQRQSSDPQVQRAPTYEESWEHLASGGTRIGTETSPVTIVEFVDFQCPFCRVFDQAVRTVMDALPGEVSLVYHHFPLTNHRFATLAAYAVECAGMLEDRFAEMAQQVFADQESVGTIPWVSFARAAGVVDTLGFNACLDDPEIHARVEEQRKQGIALGVSGTPTIFVNGWRFATPLNADSLIRIARGVMHGPSPFPTRGR